MSKFSILITDQVYRSIPVNSKLDDKSPAYKGHVGLAMLTLNSILPMMLKCNLQFRCCFELINKQYIFVYIKEYFSSLILFVEHQRD